MLLPLLIFSKTVLSVLQGHNCLLGWGWGGGGGWGKACAFHFVEIFHFEEIRSLFCLYLHNGLKFFD